MKESTGYIVNRIAEKLALRPESVQSWAEKNNFDLNQLAILVGQITYNQIDVMDVVMSVVDSTKYTIKEK